MRTVAFHHAGPKGPADSGGICNYILFFTEQINKFLRSLDPKNQKGRHDPLKRAGRSRPTAYNF
jgi:hypothetical protein